MACSGQGRYNHTAHRVREYHHRGFTAGIVNSAIPERLQTAHSVDLPITEMSRSHAGLNLSASISKPHAAQLGERIMFGGLKPPLFL